MAHIDVVDGLVGGGLLLFTGTEVAMDGGHILELISKFGVIAVLWFWLKDMRKQIRDQSTSDEERHKALVAAFKEETDELRESYEKMLIKMNEEHRYYMEKMESAFKEQTESIKEIYDLHKKSK